MKIKGKNLKKKFKVNRKKLLGTYFYRRKFERRSRNQW